MIDPRTVQSYLRTKSLYTGNIDGDIGPGSIAAMTTLLKNAGCDSTGWPPTRIRIATEQLMITQEGIDVGKVDGISGPRYQYGLELFQNHLRDVTPPLEAVQHQPTAWPRQKDIQSFYGPPGTSQIKITSPYQLYLDWDLSAKSSGFMIHSKCADSALRAMNRILQHYGPEEIHALGLDQFGGCLNIRKMRGGNAMSMHSWGCAIDWDSDRNSLRMDMNHAQLGKPEYRPFIDAWYQEGWINLGIERGFDPMHFQAARL